MRFTYVVQANPQSGTFGLCGNEQLGAVTDITVLQSANGNGSGTTSIEDDQTGATLESCSGAGCGGPLTSALYSLGAPFGGVSPYGYSLLATTPSNSTQYGPLSSIVPTWGVNSGTFSVAGTPCYAPGALYSYSLAATNTPSVFVCTFASGSGFSWKAL